MRRTCFWCGELRDDVDTVTRKVVGHNMTQRNFCKHPCCQKAFHSLTDIIRQDVELLIVNGNKLR